VTFQSRRVKTDSSGYSKTPLLKKLGIKEGFGVAVLNPPPEYLRNLGKLPEGVKKDNKSGRPFDFVHFFAHSRSQLEEEFPRLEKRLSQGGMLWISWPKRSSRVKTDLSESLVRAIGLDNGLVDAKIASINGTWSGLKFVRRLKDRK
jgi:hypothetical protein